MRYASLLERLLANSIESENYTHAGTPCWEWTAHRQRSGYARFTERRPGCPHPQKASAHRAMAALVIGRELHPDHETIEHACGITWCINPWHFEIATRAENSADMRARREGGPRLSFRRLVDPELYENPDPMTRSLPVLRSAVTADCPF